jgi:integrase
MASVVNDPNGRKRILFIGADGKRRAIRLGKATLKRAERFKDHVEELLNAAFLCRSVEEETAQFIGKLDDVLYGRLATVKLVKPRGGAVGTELVPFIDAYLADRTDVKPSTIVALKRARRDLRDHFGASKDIREITAGNADEFWRALLRRGLADNTARRICGMAKQYFRVALRKKIIADNPFIELESKVHGSSEARKFIVTREMANKVIDACPDAEWRLLFVLSRYGGLRCPSEHLALRWGDVDWGDADTGNGGTLLVHSPKTEHHEGKATRLMPLFPELRKYLMQVYAQAAEGTEHVITRYRDKNQNLRTQLQRIIRRAGLEPWPKLFHNLRATRQTELADTYPIHVVCQWIGNSDIVAKEHYLKVTEEHFAKATADGAEAAQKAAHQETEPVNKAGKSSGVENEKAPGFPGLVVPFGMLLDNRVGREGLEPPTSCV